MLLRLAETAGLDAEDAADAGREQGVIEANRAQGDGDVERMVDHLVKFGFDPEIASDDPDDFTVCFTNCPFADLAQANPDIVCSLHRGLLEGVLSSGSVQVVEFRSVADRRPCQADLTFASASSPIACESRSNHQAAKKTTPPLTLSTAATA